MIKFRQAAKNDTVKLKCIARRVIQNNYVSFLGAQAVNEFISSGMADKEIDDGMDNCYVLADEVSIIGFVIIKGHLLHLLMVDVSYQGKGYGTKILSFAEKEMAKHYNTLSLQTFKNNTKAVDFYTKNGWQLKESKTATGMNLEMLEYEKHIPANADYYDIAKKGVR